MSGHSVCRTFLLASLLLGFSCHPAGAQDSEKKDSKVSPAMKLPSGAIIVVAKDAEAFSNPDAIYLSPEKFKEINDQLESLKKQIASEKPMPPSFCELEGRIELRGKQQIVKLAAAFRFRTTANRSVIYLGCQKAHLLDAKIDDGSFPIIIANDKGLSVRIDSAGERKLQLDLEVPLMTRGPKIGEMGFEIGLPGAPITTLSFEAPAKVKRLTVTCREVGTPSTQLPVGSEAALDVKRIDADRLLPGRGPEALGPVNYLSVSWPDASQTGAVNNPLSAETELKVAISDIDIQAEARLRLRGSAKVWRFLAPYDAEVSVGKAPGQPATSKSADFPVDQAPDIVRPEPGKTEWRIRFREPNTADLLVVVRTRSPRNRGGEPGLKTLWRAGPFAVLDLSRQTGVIRIKSLPHIRVNAHPKGDTQRIDSSDDPGAEMVFQYGSLPAGAKNQPGPPLELEIRAAAGVVQTQVQHYLNLGEGGWKLRSEIKVTPIRTEIEALEVEVPVAAVFEASTPKLIEGIIPVRDNGPQRKIIELKLVSAMRNEFSLTLEGSYSMPFAAQDATLILPRFLNVFEGSAQLTVTIPDGYDLNGGAYQWRANNSRSRIVPLEPPLVLERTNTLVARATRGISRVDLSWKPLRADIRVKSFVEITLGDRQARIVQNLNYTFANRPSKKLRLRGPDTVIGVAVNEGSIDASTSGEWIVNLANEAGSEATITLTYSFNLPTGNGESTTFLTPLLWPYGVSSCENRVTIIRDRASGSFLLPELGACDWQQVPAEINPDESSLPLLVLRSQGVNLPLLLTLREPPAMSKTMLDFSVDRMLIQGQEVDGGQNYRARLHLVKWLNPSLDFELPAGATKAEAKINGIRSEIGKGAADVGQALRIALPAWRERQHLLIEIEYHLPEGRHEGIGGWITHWHPPRFRGRLAIGSIRWQVALHTRATPLSLGDAVFEERWTMHNGFAQPLTAYETRDLERWITNGQEPDGNSPLLNWELADANVTARQAGLAPVSILVIPRTIWLCSVSLIVLAVGMLWSRLTVIIAGISFILLIGVIVIIDFLWPQPTGQILAASQPGIAILLIILGFQRYMQWRYRRRLARMPNFSRLHGESPVPLSNGKRVLRETSTVDSPRVL